MKFQVTLIDGTFDLLVLISNISYHLGVVKNFQTIDNVTYEYLFYCDECNNCKSTQKF